MTNLASPEDVRSYWLDTLVPKDWFVANDQVDAAITAQFQPTWQAACDGGLTDWQSTAQGVLAYIIVTDQFPRNMFRGDGRSFATDAMARAATRLAIIKGWDMDIPEPARQFIYVTLMHSEDLGDQEDAIQYFANRMPETGHMNIDHAHAHRDVIAAYGRFPYRNDALGRTTTAAEQAFLDKGGYGAALAAVQNLKSE